MGCDELSADVLAALDDVPVFPLPGCVLFPHTLLPLHIFEPRYRQMTEAALQGSRLIVMADCDASERVREVAGVGRIVHHERLPDGRFHILLQGLARVEIVDEHPRGERLYRRVQSRLVEDSAEPADTVDEALAALRACYLRLLHAVEEPPLGDLPNTIDDPGVLADVMCAAVLGSACERQQALAERRVSARLRSATSAVADLLLRATPTGGEVH